MNAAPAFASLPLLHPRPIVKWAGGKTQMLPHLIARMPASFGDYLEPFAGGAALYLRIADGLGRPGDATQAWISDVNIDLIRLYGVISGSPESANEVAERAAGLLALHDSDRYAFERGSWNADRDHWGEVDHAATMIYLNRTCFNGLWRVNQAGDFNVPIGRSAHGGRVGLDVANLRAAAARFSRANLLCEPWQAALSRAQPGDFVYIDPPYDVLRDESSFASYTPHAFVEADQRELAAAVIAAVARGVLIMVSNADTARVRAIYAGLRVDAVTCQRSIAASGQRRARVGEVIITGGYDAQERPS